MTPPSRDIVPTRRAQRDTGDDAPIAGVVRERVRVGRYDLLFELARGGMGAVHVARAADAHGVGRLVALKTLPPGRFDADDLAAFVAEARITSHVNHPNVVQCFDFGIEDGAPFLVMQLVEGPALSRLLHVLGERGERLPVDVAVWIALQIAEGLDAAHELTGEDGASLGLVHRDVSPQNVLVSHTGRVFVADFGIAKLLEAERVTRSGELKGKLGYMSPEQTRGELLDRRTDVFAFGALLHEMLTGQRPFAASSPAEAVYRINNVDVPPVRATRPDVPDGVETLVRLCLARDRDDRPDTMKIVAADLRRALRAAGHTVDESDLASLLARVLPGERESLRDRVRAAASGEPPAPSSGDTPPGQITPEPAFPSATLTASALPGVAEQRRSLRWIGALAILAALVAIVAASLRGPPQPEPTRSTNAIAAPPATHENATPPAVDAPAVAASPSTTASAASTSSATPTPTHRASPPGRTSASAAPPPSPSATSHKGEPFRGL